MVTTEWLIGVPRRSTQAAQPPPSDEAGHRTEEEEGLHATVIGVDDRRDHREGNGDQEADRDARARRRPSAATSPRVTAVIGHGQCRAERARQAELARIEDALWIECRLDRLQHAVAGAERLGGEPGAVDPDAMVV